MSARSREKTGSSRRKQRGTTSGSRPAKAKRNNKSKSAAGTGTDTLIHRTNPTISIQYGSANVYPKKADPTPRQMRHVAVDRHKGSGRLLAKDSVLYSACQVMADETQLKEVKSRQARVRRIRKARNSAIAADATSAPRVKLMQSEIVQRMRIAHAHGADFNRFNSKGLTALHAAVNKQDEDIIRFLLSVNAYLDAKTQGGGWTALMFACRNGDYNTALLLSASGASLSIRNDFGHTAHFYVSDPRVNSALECGYAKYAHESSFELARHLGYDSDAKLSLERVDQIIEQQQEQQLAALHNFDIDLPHLHHREQASLNIGFPKDITRMVMSYVSVQHAEIAEMFQ
jgi:Ankyrin repeats (3 copies)